MSKPFFPARLAERQQAAQPAVAGTVCRVDQHGQAVSKVKPTSDDKADAHLRGAGMRAGDAC